jgi:adenylate cyclase
LKQLNGPLPEEKKLRLRIGIHLGDVMEAEGDISGDAVNVASRIEPLAEEGGICVTRQIYDQIHNKFDTGMESIGHRSLRNIIAPVEVYKIVMPWGENNSDLDGERSSSRRIAILPFDNMSPDPDDEYFADGMTEEVIATMSKLEGIEMISRTSVMRFKKTEKSMKEISADLNAGTILEGSVRKAGNRLRITVQAIDPAKDRHLWTESYDKHLEDVFAIQSEIAQLVADALRIRILPPMQTRLQQRPTEGTEAYTLYLKGRHYWNERTKEGVEKAIQYFEEAIKRDLRFAKAYAGLADCYATLENWVYFPSSVTSPKIREYTAKALELDDNLAEAHTNLAAILMSRDWSIERAELEFKRAIQ